MKTSNSSSSYYRTEKQKQEKRDLINLGAKIALVIIWSVVMLLIGMSAGFNLAVDKEVKRPIVFNQKIRL